MGGRSNVWYIYLHLSPLNYPNIGRYRPYIECLGLWNHISKTNERGIPEPIYPTRIFVVESDLKKFHGKFQASSPLPFAFSSAVSSFEFPQMTPSQHLGDFSYDGVFLFFPWCRKMRVIFLKLLFWNKGRAEFKRKWFIAGTLKNHHYLLVGIRLGKWLEITVSILLKAGWL